MATYKIITLIDITRSNPGRNGASQLEINQQANFNSLVQAIGLRSNVSWKKDPIKETGRLPEPLEGKANHWIWEFETERADQFLKGDDPVGLLVDDLHGVPIISNLTNSVEIFPEAFQTKNGNINTWIEDI